MPQPMWGADDRGGCTWVNGLWCEVTGMSATACLDAGWLARVHDGDRRGLHAAWDIAVTTHSPFEHQFRLRRPDGTDVWFLARGRRSVTADGTPCWTCGATDISGLRAAAVLATRRTDDLTSALLETRRILDNSQDAIMVLDDERRFLSMNRAAALMFERGPHEVIGRRLELVFHLTGDDLRELERVWAAFLAAGSTQIDWPMQRPSGDDIVVDVVATASYQPGHHLVTMRNVTTNRQGAAHLAARETRLRFLLEEIERVRDDERRRIAGDLHDQSLQHLIAARMTLDVAGQLEPDESGAMLGKACEVLDGAVLATREMLQRLAPLHTENRPLEESIRVQVRDLANLHAMAIDVDLDVPVTLTEERRLLVSRILGEAVVNACRHSGASQIRVGGRISGDTVQLHVSDDGSGFDPDALESHVVGLQLMRERIAALGGELTVDTVIGGGTDVAISVPLIRK